VSYFALAAAGVLAALLVKPRWSQGRQILFILIVITAGLGAYLVIGGVWGPTTTQKGPPDMFQQPLWLQIALYFSMLVGMASKYLFDAIGEGNKVEFRKWQFFKPMFVSPIIFAAIYSKVGEDSPVVLLLIFSFQNGFFWQSVLKK